MYALPSQQYTVLPISPAQSTPSTMNTHPPASNAIHATKSADPAPTIPPRPIPSFVTTIPVHAILPCKKGDFHPISSAIVTDIDNKNVKRNHE
ncbi:hypothetical protein EYC84_005861 [Monilinia fructicola]|uniref:Uncharacterized protein n=1 Tax=Monilinia fructicola TaxID=38448 RepID=A0A5M9K6G5_MONFR|nr:hypothetical protein EYC84_005861 [Monilinia fructicola]